MTTEVDAFAERILEDTTRALEALSVDLGRRLGLYAALAAGAATSAEVAERAGVAPRYAREWLEQQATAGVVACADVSAAADQRRYLLPPAHAEVLLDPASPAYVGPATQMLAGVAGVLPELAQAYRTGGGVPYAAYGEDIRRGIAALNGPMFALDLAAWLEAIPQVQSALGSAPEPRVLDLGCGTGASTLALARARPDAQVEGIDLDADSIREAEAAALGAGVDGRVRFSVADAAGVPPARGYQLVTVFEALHDMADPIGALAAARDVLAPSGVVLVADERVADDLQAPGDLLERFQFGWSVLHCLPATMAEDPQLANGTMLRAPTLRAWASEAGYGGFQVAGVDNDFWRFYVLTQDDMQDDR